MYRAARNASLPLSLLILISSASLTAQDESFAASAGKFQCSADASFVPVDDRYNGVSLAPLESAPKDLPATKPRTFGPFADGMSVEFYQSLTGGGEASMATETDLHLYVHVVTRKEKRWYELRSQDPQTMKADPGPAPEGNDQKPGSASLPIPPTSSLPIPLSRSLR